MSRHGLHPAMRFRGLRYPRTMGEAFRDPQWCAGFERHIPPPFWVRVALFLRRRFT